MADRVHQRPGGRSARIRADALASTIELLAERGAAGLDFDAIADRSGVHRTTLYRRWGSPVMIAVDALTARSDAVVRVPDEGSLEADLRSLVEDVRANLESPAGNAITRALVADHGDEVVEAARRFWDDRLARMRVVVDRAVARGEITHVDPSFDPTVVIELAVAPLFFRLLVDHRPLDDDFLETVVRALVSGLRR
jgi:AcrR family transcriptional regulator